MTTARCPACHAAVPADAGWCNLCFADLRPKPVAVAPEPVSVGPAASLGAPAAPAYDPLTSPLPPAAPAYDALASPLPPAPPTYDPLTALLPPVAPADTPVSKAADVRLATPSWPCTACGSAVPLDVDACPVCGAGFLDGSAARMSFELPVVGDVTRLTTGQKWAFAGVVAVAVCAVMWVLFFIVGSML